MAVLYIYTEYLSGEVYMAPVFKQFHFNVDIIWQGIHSNSKSKVLNHNVLFYQKWLFWGPLSKDNIIYIAFFSRVSLNYRNGIFNWHIFMFWKENWFLLFRKIKSIGFEVILFRGFSFRFFFSLWYAVAVIVIFIPFFYRT